MGALNNKKIENLRRRAEELLAKGLKNVQSGDLATISELVQELATHQAELEMQNQELVESQLELQKAKDKFADLFEYAPAGYVILDASGIIRESNRTWQTMLNRLDDDFRGVPFINTIISEDAPIFRARYRALFRNPKDKQITVRISRKNGLPFHARIEAAPRALQSVKVNAKDESHKELLVIINDVSDLYLTKKKIEIANIEITQAKDKVDHVNRVLTAIRKVSQLIYSENNQERLIQGACNKLTETLGYHHVWIALFEGGFGKVSLLASSGFGPEFERLHLKLKQGDFPKSLRIAVSQEEPVVILDPDIECTDCPLSGEHVGKSGMSCRLSIEDRIFGVLSVSVPSEYAQDPEELSIFKELAKEIAFALHKIELDKGLRIHSEKLHAAMQLGNLAWWEMQMPSGLAMCDDRKIGMLERDPKAYQNVHYSAFTDLLHPDDYENTMQAMRDHLEGRAESYLVDYRIKKRDNSYLWYHDRGGIVERHPDGSPKRISGLVMDITNRKKAEEALRASEEKFRTLVETMREGLGIGDEQGRFTYVNPVILNILGRTQDELLNHKFTDYLDEENRIKFLEQQELRKRGISENYVLSVKRKDGSIVYVYASGHPIHNSQGEFIGSFGVLTDITELKEAEEKILVFKTLADSASYGLATANLSGVLSYCNKAWAEMHGFEKDELIGKHLSISHPESEIQKVDAIIGQLLQEGNHTAEEIWHIKKDGTIFPALMNGTLISNPLGKPIFISITAMDITERKQAEVALQKAKSEAEKANRAKSEFLANMSHEIRTPMNAIIGMTELTLSTPLNNEQREYLEIVRFSAESLLALVNDILDFSKIEAGYLKLEDTEFDLRHLMESTLSSLAIKAHEKGLELIGRIHPRLHNWYRGDPYRLRQIIVNLVGNAIKFTKHGEVVAEVDTEEIDDLNLILKFSISDTGIGISPEQQERIFDRFAQAEEGTTREFGGTGLGVNISKQLVEMMGGQLWVVSKPTKGSTFFFTIKACKAHPVTLVEPLPVDEVKGLKVLIVDDNSTNRLILRENLAVWDIFSEEASNGPEALRKMYDWQKYDDAFDLAILDVNMPEMNGFELGRNMRYLPKGFSLPIIFLTSKMGHDDKDVTDLIDRSIYLTKPVKQDDLLAAILQILDKFDCPKKPTLDTFNKSLQPMEILLAEDNLFNQKLAVTLLKKRGHKVTVVENGAQAVDHVKDRRFDIVLMDVNMPIMNGLEAARTIRKFEKQRGQHTTIVAMTALASAEYRDKCFAAGMDTYITKPIQRDELFNTIETFVTKQPILCQSKEFESSLRIFNYQTFFNLVDGDQQLFKEILNLFINDLPRRVEEITNAVELNDSQKIEASAHSIKGSLLNISAGEAAIAASKLEQAGKMNQLNKYKEYYFGLLEELEKLVDILNKIDEFQEP